MYFTGKIMGTYSAKEKLATIKRPETKSLRLVISHGIQDDRYAGKDLDKSVMLVGMTAYDIANKNNIEIEYGSLGENIITDFNPNALNNDTVLEIGDAKMQITQKCSMCESLNIYDKQLAKLLKDCRGVYCKVIKSGWIRTGDSIIIKEKR